MSSKTKAALIDLTDKDRAVGPMEAKSREALAAMRKKDPGPLNTTHRRRTGRVYTWSGHAP